jgi:multiple sugar transport system ATP-binding protein
MTVLDNIAFPLIMNRFKPWFHLPIVNSIARRVIRNSPEVKERVTSVATMLELELLLNRRPRTLSGGQRQRVAVARALVSDPELYLLDEPLSNLDAKLRTQMRAEITSLYKKVRKTFIYVTHDQVEAMTMASRIIVMDEGRIRQVGTPDEVYHNPADTFVARFIGAPSMNLIPVEVKYGAVSLPGGQGFPEGSIVPPADGPSILGIRPENITVARPKKSGIVATVQSVENLGAEAILGFSLGDETSEHSALAADMNSRYFARIEGNLTLNEGSRVMLEFNTSGVRWFSSQTELAVKP